MRMHDPHLGTVRALEEAAQQADGAAVDHVPVAIDRQHQSAALRQVVEGDYHLQEKGGGLTGRGESDLPARLCLVLLR